MRLVIFDFDGTICDTKESILKVIKLTYESINIFLQESTVENTLKSGCTLEETFSKINSEFGIDVNQESLVTKYRDIYNKNAYKYITIYDGVREFFYLLYETKIPVVILSNKGEKSINKILEFNNIAKYITEVIGADSCEFKKPDKRLFTDVIAKKYPEVTKNDIYVIGDTVTDIIFAKSASLKSCFVKYGYGNHEDCLRLNPDFIIDKSKNLEKLKRFL